MGIVDRIRNRLQSRREPTAIEPTAPKSTAIERSMGEGGMTAQLTDANPFSGFGYVKRQEDKPGHLRESHERGDSASLYP